MAAQYRSTSYRVNATQYLASRRTGKLVLQPTTLSMSSHRSCIDRQIPSTGQTRHHHIAVVYDRLPPSSTSFEAIALCNDNTSENRTSFGGQTMLCPPNHDLGDMLLLWFGLFQYPSYPTACPPCVCRHLHLMASLSLLPQ